MATEPTSVRVESQMSISSTTFFQMIVDKNLDLLEREGGVEGVMRNLNTDREHGITSNSVAQREEVYGKNELPEEEEVTYWKYLKEALSDKMMILLLVLGAVALVIGLTTPEQGKDEVNYSHGWIDGTFIIVAVTIVILITTVNDYMKGLKFQALNRLTSKIPFEVLRDGKVVTVDVAELVVGDVVMFQGGTFLPADGLFLGGQGVAVDESAATGENDDKKKDLVKDPFILSGTNVLAGVDGMFLCIGVGEKSFSGTIEMNAREKGRTTATPLQEKLDDLADTVGWVGIGVALILFITLALISIIKSTQSDDSYDFKLLLDYAIIGVSIIVVAVPEGLPLSVVIALAYSMQAMMKDNNMVRSLAACETMGAATSICSDKTGTLTTNEMTQIRASIGGVVTEDYDHNGSGLLSLKELSGELSQKSVDLYLESLFYNSTATKIDAPPGTKSKVSEDGKIWTGNKTEQGLLRWAERAGGKGVLEYRERKKNDVCVYPFRSDKKSMTTLVRRTGGEYFGGDKVVQYTKGATEVIFEHSKSYLDKDGVEQEMTEEFLAEAKRQLKEFASEGLRTLGVAYRVHGGYDAEFPEEDPFSNNLVLLGFSAIQDPVRTEVPDAVASCMAAGVTVRMCTGDNLDTAKAISKRCGIYTEGSGVAMEGPAFRRLFCEDEEKFMEMLPTLQVLARCSPLDKQLLVGNLMLLGEVVAVTGDGTNDAPALKLADVGFAMNDGTDVAKKASKIILLDNNFVSVVKACKWGRNVNDNIRKFLQFQFTVNVVLLIITFLGAVNDAARDGNGEPPLAPIHLLWANLIMDTMAAMALSTENPNDLLLTRPPTYRDAPLISNKMRRFILGNSVWQLAVMVTLIFAGEGLFDTKDPYTEFLNTTAPLAAPMLATPDHQDSVDEDNATRIRTVIFNVFIFMQVFNWFHARKLYDEWNFLEGFGRSPFFLPIVIFTACFQVFVVEVAGSFMETISPGGVRWGVAVALGFTMWPWGVMLRFVPVEEAEHEQKRLDHEVKGSAPDEDEGEEDDEGEYSAHTKLKMVMDVRKQQRLLFKGSPAFKEAEPPAKKPWERALANIQRRITVLRALRGARGSTLSHKQSSGLSHIVKSNLSELASRRTSSNLGKK